MPQRFVGRHTRRVLRGAVENLESRRLFAGDLHAIRFAGPAFAGSDPSSISQRPHQVVGSTLAQLAAPAQVGPTVYTDDLSTGTIVQPQSLAPFQAGVYLTGPSRQLPVAIVLKYLRDNTASLQLTPADVAAPFVTSSYSDADTGVTHIYMRQEFAGLPVTNADINATVLGDGRLQSIGGGFVRNLDRAGASVTPALSEHQALVGMARAFGTTLALTQVTTTLSAAAKDVYQTTTLSAPAFSSQPVLAKLGFITTSGGVTLAWNLNAQTLDGRGWWDTYVDATTGRVLYGSNWTSNYVGGGGTAGAKNRVESAAGPGLTSPLSSTTPTTDGAGDSDGGNSGGGGGDITNNTVTDGSSTYLVYDQPKLSPDSGARATVSSSTAADPKASPFGWHDTNGVTGAEFTATIGNNVSAQDDIDSNNTGGTRPDGGTTLNFNNPIDFAQAPLTYVSAATTNLFYWNNVLHDIHYEYGFTEPAGNFQTNNYGKGGNGNDAVQADSQDGSTLSTPNVNNANFSTPADGSAGRMQMYTWNKTTPNRDGDLDSRIIVHEYGHGVSNRLSGGPANASALTATQSAGMGEGWSDWWSLMLTQTATSAQNDRFPVGTYVLGQSATGAGIRRYPYSYNMASNPETLGTFNISSEVHNTGELWCTVLWDLNWNLITKFGFSTSLSTGYVLGGPNAGTGAGNKLALKLVMDALKLQPVNPTFLQARDAIIQADQNLTGGANIQTIWRTFARRGWGFSAATSGSSSTSVTEAFDVPANLFDPFVTGTLPATTAIANFNAISFNFSEAMDPTSFSLSGIKSFSGPGNVNLVSQLTGFSWTTSKTLKVNLNTQTTLGAYTMVLNPVARAADNGNLVDQNQNGITGEATDTYTASITYSPLTTPDSFGYQAGLTSLTVPTLTSGAAGVTSVLANTDDSAVAVGLGSNSFSFYGTSYTALFVSTNGLITFGSSNTSANPSNLGSSPSQAAIAPLWQDWVTNTTGNTTEKVLYRTDDSNSDGLPDRLIIQWTDVRVFGNTANGATFSVALQLNTAAAAGTILFNYPDLNTANTSSNGGMAATGIKDVGTQDVLAASRRVLINQATTTNPYVQQGSVVRISNDWNAPTAVASYQINQVMPSVNYAFSRPVDGGSVTVFSQATGANIAAGNISTLYFPATNTVSVSFPGFVGGLLPTGGYVFTLSGYIDSALNTQGTIPDKTLLVDNCIGSTSASLSISGASTVLIAAGTSFATDSSNLLGLDIRGTGSLDLTVDLAGGNPVPATNRLQVPTTSLTVTGTSGDDAFTVGVPGAGGALDGASISTIAFNGGGGSDTLTLNTSSSFTASTGTTLKVGGTATATVLVDTVLEGLTVAAGGRLDIRDKSLILRSGNIATLSALTALGLGTNGQPLWSGTGITSSVAAADALGFHGVGLIANRLGGANIYDTFHGSTVGDNDLLLAYTLFGDADLSGVIDDADFFLSNNGYAVHLTGWVNGDYDYSGNVDDTDYFLLNNGYARQ